MDFKIFAHISSLNESKKDSQMGQQCSTKYNSIYIYKKMFDVIFENKHVNDKIMALVISCNKN